MSQKISFAPDAKGGVSGTESLIQQALTMTQARRIVVNPQYLDDEKLPEVERIAVLQKFFTETSV